MARKKMRHVVGVVRSPWASPGQVVELDVNKPPIPRYLDNGVLRLADTDEMPEVEEETTEEE